jgi:nitrate reductase assembly molybdenum cofactor insertion protein NarJ
MATECAPTLDEIAALPEAERAAAARSGTYAVLARAFSFPDDCFFGFFGKLRELGEDSPEGLPEGMAAFIEAARAEAADDVRQQHIKLFDPVQGPFPYETEFRGLKDFNKAQVMADIMGFYRAFGVEPQEVRADHISSELEFMHLLAAKECRALGEGDEEKAVIARDAQVKFFKEHIGSWAGRLVPAMRERLEEGGAEAYAGPVAALEEFVESEREAFR